MSQGHISILNKGEEELAPIREEDRKGRGIDQFYIWMGANIAVTNWALGALPITLGLSLQDAIWMMVIGNLIGAVFFALCTLPGKNTGLTAMISTRFSFGKKGAISITLLQLINTIVWLGINTYFAVNVAVEILNQFGIEKSFLINFLTSLVIFAMQVLVAVYGFRFIQKLDQIIVPLMILLMFVMTYFAFENDIQWTEGALSGADRFGMMALTFAAAGIGWPLSWTTWAGDYSRHVPRKLSNRKLFWACFLGMFVATVWLEIVGAVIAQAMGTGLDPAAMVTGTVPGFVLPALILIFLGTVSTNVLNVESGGLTLIAAGVRLERWKTGFINGIIGFVICMLCIIFEAIGHLMQQWMLTLILWMTPWTVITIMDLLYFKKDQLMKGIRLSDPVPSVRKSALISWFVGFVVSLLYANTPLFVGPFAKMSYGADFSWVIGIGLTSVLYLGLGMAEKKRNDSSVKLQEMIDA